MPSTTSIMADKEEPMEPLNLRKESIDITGLDDHHNHDEGHDHDNHHDRINVTRSESLDISLGSFDHMVKHRSNSGSTIALPSNLLFRRESDASVLLHVAGRKNSDASGGGSISVSALHSISSLRKDSDLSALSALVKDEEEMMQQHEAEVEAEAEKVASGTSASASASADISGRETPTPLSIRKDSDPFENLRKLSDASSAVSALRKMSEESDPLKSFRKDSDATLGDGVGVEGDFKSPESAILGDMKLKCDSSKDDASVHLFENPHAHPNLTKDPEEDEDEQDHDHQVQPTPVFKKATAKYTSLALEHLDMLGSDKSEDGSSSTVTMNEANQKLLMEAMLGSGRNRAESWGGMSDMSANQMARIESIASAVDVTTADIPRGPSPHGFEGVIMSPRSQSQDSLTGHLQQAEDGKKRGRRSSSGDQNLGTPLIKGRDRLDSITGLNILCPKGRDRAGSISRDRLDSWTVRDRIDSIATRDRLDSLATRDRLDSLANLSGIFSKGRDRLDSLASLGEVSLTMSLGDLEDVAGKLESIVHGDESDAAESASESAPQSSSKKSKGSLPAPTIQVDPDAVQSAVQAAMAATTGGILDILQINTPGKGPAKGGSGNNHDAATPLISNAKIKLGPNGANAEVKMEEIRARARAAAGYVHPGTDGSNAQSKSKKRPLPTAMNSLKRPKLNQFSTPLAQPKLAKSGRGGTKVAAYSEAATPTPKKKTYAKSPASSTKGGQSNQKWEEMFECLVVYVKDQRAEGTRGMSEAEAQAWEWSGNVPTMYKTKNGKALGRWINNQRSAKSKGSLKPEREQRLVGTGLKWSVLTTNAWTDMMEELKIYVKEKTTDGKKWDGNVPTNYKIKNNAKTEGLDLDDEDKNLGRWINRQRSLYQAGKLKDDRRKQLELIGLKWAVLSTTSWHTMYESLVKYANEKREMDANKYWDGNVPASYETDDKPPKKLGRWVNRQRSAYANKKLKKEFVDKLEKAGLKWTAMDSKKDLENSELLMRQRSFNQTQRPPIIRSIPSITRPIITNSRTTLPGIRPVVSGPRPGLVSSGVRSAITVQSGTKPNVLVSGVRPITQGATGVRPVSMVSGIRPSAQGSSVRKPDVIFSGVPNRQPVNGIKIVQQKQVIKQGIQPSASRIAVVSNQIGISTAKPAVANSRVSTAILPKQNGVISSKATVLPRASSVHKVAVPSHSVPPKLSTPPGSVSVVKIEPGNGITKTVATRTLVQGQIKSTSVSSKVPSISPSPHLSKAIVPTSRASFQTSNSKSVAPKPTNLHSLTGASIKAPLPTAKTFVTPTVPSNNMVNIAREGGNVQRVPIAPSSAGLGATSTPAVGISTNNASKQSTQKSTTSPCSKQQPSVRLVSLKNNKKLPVAATHTIQKTLPTVSMLGLSQSKHQPSAGLASSQSTKVSKVAIAVKSTILPKDTPTIPTSSSKVALTVKSNYLPKVTPSSNISTTSSSNTPAAQLQAVTALAASPASNSNLGA